MIAFTLEIPTFKLEDWSAYTDLDFALAHQVLADPAYCRFYAKRRAGRELILDNSFHELGAPLAIPDLLRAAELVHADYLISPDKLEDPIWTLNQFFALQKAAPRTQKLAVVLGGETVEDRTHFLRATAAAEMLCLPYRRPRLEWFLEQNRIPEHRRIHLLGVSSIQEVQAWNWVLAHLGNPPRVSIDTSKPIKWGLLGQQISLTRSLRHAPLSSAALLEIKGITQAQHELVCSNIRLLKLLIQ